MPMTQAIINLVEAMADKQGMDGLKLTSCTGHILWDSAWIAGVDYTKDNEEAEDESVTSNTSGNDEVDPNEMEYDEQSIQSGPTSEDNNNNSQQGSKEELQDNDSKQDNDKQGSEDERDPDEEDLDEEDEEGASQQAPDDSG